MTSTVTIKVIAEIITPRISCICWQRGQLDRVILFEWGGFCQHKTIRTRVQSSRASDFCCSLYGYMCRENDLEARKSRNDVEKEEEVEEGWERERDGEVGKRQRERQTDRHIGKAYLLACRQQFFFRAGAMCTGPVGWGRGRLQGVWARGSAVHPIIPWVHVSRRCTTQ